MSASKSNKVGKKVPGKTEQANKKREVELTFYAPHAKGVFLAGTFNDWNTESMPMKKDTHGVWRVKLKLTPGKYEYKYFVDGEWDMFEAPERECVQNPYGTKNCVMNIQPEQSAA